MLGERFEIEMRHSSGITDKHLVLVLGGSHKGVHFIITHYIINFVVFRACILFYKFKKKIKHQNGIAYYQNMLLSLATLFISI